MLFLDLSQYSTLLRDLSLCSNETFNFSALSVCVNLNSWNLSLSGLSVLFLGFSLLSVLFLGPSKQSLLRLACSNPSTLLLPAFLRYADFSTVDINFLRCLRYSGYISKLQWLPPLSHRGSYFSWHSSQSCLPWEQSTTSSAVPCKKYLRFL